MKKTKTGIILTVFLILIVFLFFYFKPKNKEVIQDVSPFSSIKDALVKKLNLICEFKDKNNISTKSYIKNGLVRVSIGVDDKSQSSEILLKDNLVYMWNLENGQGFIDKIPENSASGEASSDQNQNFLKFIEDHKESCKVSNVDDYYFEVPTNIKFQDMSKLLEDLKLEVPQNTLQ